MAIVDSTDYKLKIKFVLTIFVSAVALFPSRQSVANQLLDQRAIRRCEILLTSSNKMTTLEDGLQISADLELEVSILGSMFPGVEFGEIHSKIEDLTNSVFDERPLSEIRAQSESIVQLLLNLKLPNENQMPTDTISFLVLHPDSVQPLIWYSSSAQYIHQVSFGETAVSSLRKLSEDSVKRLFRAIEKGFVPSGSGSGIVRITDVHKNLVEIKTNGKGGGDRLLGCLQGKELIVKKLYQKRNEGSGGSLAEFSYLCK